MCGCNKACAACSEKASSPRRSASAVRDDSRATYTKTIDGHEVRFTYYPHMRVYSSGTLRGTGGWAGVIVGRSGKTLAAGGGRTKREAESASRHLIQGRHYDSPAARGAPNTNVEAWRRHRTGRDPARSRSVQNWEVVCPDGRVRHYPYLNLGDAEDHAKVVSDPKWFQKRGCRLAPEASDFELSQPPCPGGVHGVKRAGAARNGSRSTRAARRDPTDPTDNPFPKTCARCGHVYRSREWNRLPFLGTMPSPDDEGDIALRNCTCGTTFAVPAAYDNKASGRERDPSREPPQGFVLTDLVNGGVYHLEWETHDENGAGTFRYVGVNPRTDMLMFQRVARSPRERVTLHLLPSEIEYLAKVRSHPTGVPSPPASQSRPRRPAGPPALRAGKAMMRGMRQGPNTWEVGIVGSAIAKKARFVGTRRIDDELFAVWTEGNMLYAQPQSTS